MTKLYFLFIIISNTKLNGLINEVFMAIDSYKRVGQQLAGGVFAFATFPVRQGANEAEKATTRANDLVKMILRDIGTTIEGESNSWGNKDQVTYPVGSRYHVMYSKSYREAIGGLVFAGMKFFIAVAVAANYLQIVGSFNLSKKVSSIFYIPEPGLVSSLLTLGYVCFQNYSAKPLEDIVFKEASIPLCLLGSLLANGQEGRIVRPPSPSSEED